MKSSNLRKLFLLPAVVWITGCPALLMFSLLSNAFRPGLAWELYFAAVTIFSPIAFLAFGWDKWKAQRETSRIPEKRLHFLALMGGWPGAVLGQRSFRHKTIKPVFRSILLTISWLHIAVVTFAAWKNLF